MKVKSLLGVLFAAYGFAYLVIFSALTYCLFVLDGGVAAIALMLGCSALCLMNSLMGLRLAMGGWSKAFVPSLVFNIINPVLLPFNVVLALMTVTYHAVSSFQLRTQYTPQHRQTPVAKRRIFRGPGSLGGPNPARRSTRAYFRNRRNQRPAPSHLQHVEPSSRKA